MHIYLVRGRKQIYCPWNRQLFNDTKPRKKSCIQGGQTIGYNRLNGQLIGIFYTEENLGRR